MQLTTTSHGFLQSRLVMMVRKAHGETLIITWIVRKSRSRCRAASCRRAMIRIFCRASACETPACWNTSSPSLSAWNPYMPWSFMSAAGLMAQQQQRAPSAALSCTDSPPSPSAIFEQCAPRALVLVDHLLSRQAEQGGTNMSVHDISSVFKIGFPEAPETRP